MQNWLNSLTQEIWADAHDMCETAYSSSCSQTLSLTPAISLQFILGVCAAAEDRKNQ